MTRCFRWGGLILACRRWSARISSVRPTDPVAYHLVQLDRRGTRYRVALVSVYTGQPASHLETEEVKVERQARRYLIAQIKRTGRAEAILSGQAEADWAWRVGTGEIVP